MARKIIVWLAALFIVVNLTIVLIVVLGGKSTPPPVLPNPNGYDDLKRATTLVAGDPSGYAKLERDPLAALVATNAPALQATRLGLTRESRVPVQFTPDYANQLGPELGGFKQLSFLFAAESRLAEMEGRTNDAARICVEGMRFGEETGRGGLLIHRLVAVGSESIAANRLDLQTMTPDAPTCREIVGELQRIDGAEDPIAVTLQLEELFSKQANGLKGRLAYLFLSKKMLEPAIAKAAGKANVNMVHRRDLMAKFAARAYELEKGKRAENWNDLVPAYLKAIPKDPTSGAELNFPR